MKQRRGSLVSWSVVLAAIALLLPTSALADGKVAGWSVEMLATDTPSDWGRSPWESGFSTAGLADDGRLVYISKGEADAERAVFLYDSATGESRRLSEEAAGASQPWLRGDLVAWAAPDGPDTEIYLHTLSTGQTIKVTDNLDTDSAPRLADGYLVWSRGEQTSVSMWAYDLATGASRQLTVPGYNPQLKVGGTWAIQAQYSRDKYSVTVYDLETGEKSQPPGLQDSDVLEIQGDLVLARHRGPEGVGLYDLGTESWQPLAPQRAMWADLDDTGTRVAYPEWTSTGAHIRLRDLESGAITSIPVPGMAVGEVALHGDIIFYRAATIVGKQYGPGRWYAMVASQGTATQVFPGNYYLERLASDGTNVYWFTPLRQERPEPPYYEPYPPSLLQLMVATPPATAPVAFTDVSATSAMRTAVLSLAERGIVSGYAGSGGAAFRPTDKLQRAQFAKIVSLAAGLHVEEALSSGFADLGPDNDTLYPHEFVAAASQAGIIRGFGDGTFGPYRSLNRAQLVSMVVRAAEAMDLTLDTPPEDYFRYGPRGIITDPVHGRNWVTAGSNGFLDGVADYPVRWDPYAPATRADAAQVVWNLLKFKDFPWPNDGYWYPYW